MDSDLEQVRRVGGKMGWFARVMGVLLFFGAALVCELSAQSDPSEVLPFGPGESLVYKMRSARFGVIGEGTMWVGEREEVRGRGTYHLQFELRGRVGPFSIEDHTQSWLDPVGPTALRFEKRESHPLASNSESVDIFPEESVWRTAGGRSGTLNTGHPLDELSFIYLLRMIDLEEGVPVSLDRHYDLDRNPVRVLLVRREEVNLPIGFFPALVVEMQVQDGRRFNGSGLIRLYLTDDGNRYPVRIETTMPVIGKLVLDLESMTPGSGIPVPASGKVPAKDPVKPD